ncbi:MAG: DNA topoisomerase I [Candidatus Pacebacteria bacterium RIFOXYB1_FULL_39_46]|nr:MAG: DNA topoisomerase I [Candidatus Pacebacteria bacterium RIFOXYA1_FULL_38_18]OGJ38445.1 MAG: DNA topoisomerase I [Candidatus Pacebacteria bacterium RIFOXYB1_FULL_39_46]OGJ40305.1 MAG: DNA topoisomerase I [Candidatus Pacebacteria bacterium RIFOXYC1_FULL_39_21]OGJ40878.1 MAG: DNA topoisomerase I [Candidatus Pacebacteria bacterium RIFOXYD1_FULL_39_27]
MASKIPLVVVESPTKARKLRDYLGDGFVVEASVGHIRDLPKSKLGIDIDHDFEPEYAVVPGKQKVITQLKKQAKNADKIYLAMDPDREGEAIAWHVKHILTEKGTDREFLRATFHQITKDAVQEAMAHPSKILMELVDAQQARRVVDRLVGYKVSPVLWKKVRRGLSAGRVQSVALRLIVEREREIEAFKPEEYWEIAVGLNVEDSKITVFADNKPIQPLPIGIFVAQVTKVDTKKYEPKQEKDVTPVIDLLEKAAYTIVKIEQKDRQRHSLPPFITSTLQQSAANRLGFSAKQTMAVAQQLYEEGIITYHRTDSFTLAASALNDARQVVKTEFGQEYLPEKVRVFANKSKNAQEAHEAIRPTNAKLHPNQLLAKISSLSTRHQKLYDLIWRRLIASQMAPARYKQTKATIEAKHQQATAELIANGSIQEFAGWTILFKNSEDVILPDLAEQQSVYRADINPQQKFTLPPPRYNDASLIKELEKRGIGRPSTYASIISVILDRGYVERIEKRFWATNIGKVVSDFLLQYFPVIMDYDFTAEMEEDLDRIARGEKEWRQVVGNFFLPLSKKIKEVEETADRAEIPVEKTGEKCPLCGETDQGEIVIREGKFGKFRSCNRFPDCKFTENIVEKLAGQRCPLCGEGDVVIKPTRWRRNFYGCSRYPKCNWASWSKPEPDLKITPEEWAIEQQKREERKQRRSAGKTAKLKKSKKNSGSKKSKKSKPAKKSAKKPTKKTTQKSTQKKK